MQISLYNTKIAFLAMVIIVAASNYLVLFPINDWLTWGAFLYPVTFFVTELTNRFHGPKMAYKVICAGFIAAVIISIKLASPKIALASGSAFLISQILDVLVFNRFRQLAWWYAPFFASVSASFIDTVIFWNVAFWGENLPIFSWALGDFSVKLLFDFAMLTPFRMAIRNARQQYINA